MSTLSCHYDLLQLWDSCKSSEFYRGGRGELGELVYSRYCYQFCVCVNTLVLSFKHIFCFSKFFCDEKKVHCDFQNYDYKCTATFFIIHSV